MILPPPPAAFLMLMNLRQQKKVPKRLTMSARSHVSVGRSATSFPDASTPALFIRMCSVSNSSSACEKSFSTCSSSLMSACTTSPRCP